MRRCCCGGGGPPNPCGFDVGFQSSFTAASYTNSAVLSTGGDLTVNDITVDLPYDTTTVPSQPGWYAGISESWSLTNFTIGLSQFNGFTQTNAYGIRIVKQTTSSALTAYDPSIGPANSKITINSTNDNGYVVFVRSLLHGQFNGTIYPNIGMDSGGCPVLPLSRSGNSLFVREVYYRNGFGTYVSDTIPVSSQYFSYSGFGHTLDLSEI